MDLPILKYILILFFGPTTTIYIYIYSYIYIYIRCLNTHGTYVTANNSTNNNVVFFFFRFESSISKQFLILHHNALDKRGKNILPHYLFGERIIQNCLKIDTTHLIGKWFITETKNSKKDCMSRKLRYINNFKKYQFNVSSSKDAFFTGRIPNNCHCICLSNKSLSY